MPNTKVTKQKWKDHLSYSKKIYIIGALVAIAVAGLIFSVTRYTPANEHSVHIQLIDSYGDPTKLNSETQELFRRGLEYDSTLEEVQFLFVPHSGDMNDYEGEQVYQTRMADDMNDIFIQSKFLTDRMININYCLPMETLTSFEEFNAKYGQYVIWQEEPHEETEEEEDDAEEPIVYPDHAYAIDMSTLTGFNERGAFDIRNKYAVVTRMSANPDTALQVIMQIFDIFVPTQPKGE